MRQPRSFVLWSSFGLLLAGCSKAPAAAPTAEPGAAAQPEAPAVVVPNLEAQPGDTTTCPYSGRSFVVKAEDPRVEYEGKTYWVCSEDAAEAVRADPGKYLDDFEG
ncbi:MAG: hypothetical protein AB1Z98_29670 [Nannocystaceae bacterium]